MYLVASVEYFKRQDTLSIDLTADAVLPAI
jgi:hypothetical protein